MLYPARQEGGEPVIKTTLSKMTAEQRRIHEILGLKEYEI